MTVAENKSNIPKPLCTVTGSCNRNIPQQAAKSDSERFRVAAEETGVLLRPDKYIVYPVAAVIRPRCAQISMPLPESIQPTGNMKKIGKASTAPMANSTAIIVSGG